MEGSNTDKLYRPSLAPQNWGGGASLFFLFALWGFLLALPLQAAPPQVLVVSIHGTIWPGTAVFVKKQLDTAYQSGAAGVILDLDTTGGSSAAATEIKQSILDHASAYPIAAFVHDRATGPGSLIAVACKTLVFAPGATLGSAGGGSKSDYSAAASANNRNPAIAAAFVSADSDFPALGVKAGDPLTLTATQAQSVGYADLVTPLPSAILAKMGPGLAGSQLVPVELSLWNTIALWVTQPWATIVILALGLALVMAEILTLHSWGAAGIFGGVLIGVIFAAYITVGAATWIGILLFLAGSALLLLETHVLPGHGWPAFTGLALIFVGLFYALGGPSNGALYPATTSLFMTLAILIAFFLYLPRSGVWKRLGQPLRQTALGGYVSSDDYTSYLGQFGTAVTLLRPSGIAEFDDVRLSVVTEGEFIAQGTQVQIVMVQGSRIVVRGPE
ncbi:MAG: NfeD family protein [Janthinobacterium lividum]